MTNKLKKLSLLQVYARFLCLFIKVRFLQSLVSWLNVEIATYLKKLHNIWLMTKLFPVFWRVMSVCVNDNWTSPISKEVVVFLNYNNILYFCDHGWMGARGQLKDLGLFFILVQMNKSFCCKFWHLELSCTVISIKKVTLKSEIQH